MTEVCCATEAASDLDAIAAQAWALELPPERRRGLLCHEAAVRVDGLLTRFARGRGALDVAIGEGLVALGIGDRALQLGYSGISDYAREQLGIAASTAHKMARLARGLRDRPFLREAVWTGEVTARQAETMLPVARGDNEASWVARARAGETVRELKAAVKAATGAEAEQDEEWERVSVPLSPEARPVVEKALELAGRILGTTAPKWQRIEAICKEYLGAHCQPDDAAGAGVLCGPVDDGLDLFMQYLEQQQWLLLLN